MEYENLDSLTIRHNFSTGKIKFKALRGNCDIDDESVRLMFGKHYQREYIEKIVSMLEIGRHFGINFHYNKKYRIRYIMSIHSVRDANPPILGGTRRYPADTSEFILIKDGLDLARGMSYKNIAAGIPAGGCKATIAMDSLDVNNREVMEFLAHANEVSGAVTAPDMNLPAEMSDVMKDEGFSTRFTGGKKAKTGVTGNATAYGLILSLKAALKFYEGSDSLKDKKILLTGLGAVGKPAAEMFLKEGAKLIIATRTRANADTFKAKRNLSRIEVIEPKQVLEIEADILCPCAFGGLIGLEDVQNLKVKYIWGAANNQLRILVPEDEIAIAKELEKRGIVFQAEWWHNCGGIMCMAEEYYHDGDEKTLRKKIAELLPRHTRENLQRAEELNITPLEACYNYCDEILYGK